MAYDEFLEERITRILDRKKIAYQVKKMMGGLCYMIDDKMCVGIIQNDLMCRIDPELYQSSLDKEHCAEMKFTGRAMKGYILVTPGGIDADDDLEYWVQLCLDFNPRAKSSKRKKRK